MEDWIVPNGYTIELVNWYLNDDKSRQWLENKTNELWKEYAETLDGNVRIRWNHIYSLLNNSNINDKIKLKLFNEFVSDDTDIINRIAIDWKEEGIFEPISL